MIRLIAIYTQIINQIALHRIVTNIKVNNEQN